MQETAKVSTLRAAVRSWRAASESVAFVPTMGNLHAGHYFLLKLARSRCRRVVVSVFVNPAQFGPGEDFERYPRTLEQDRAGLSAHQCDLLFTPDTDTVYPFGIEHAVSVHVPNLTTDLEAAHRPRHFDGVATVVARLLHMVQPDIVVFGRKDYQQLRVIERMVQDMAMPVEVISGETQREHDGLALSSRNQLLSPANRQRAAQMHAALQLMHNLHRGGHARISIEQAATAHLLRFGFEPDYAVIRRAADLGQPNDSNEPLLALIAARLGSVRLIDNLPL